MPKRYVVTLVSLLVLLCLLHGGVHRTKERYGFESLPMWNIAHVDPASQEGLTRVANGVDGRVKNDIILRHHAFEIILAKRLSGAVYSLKFQNYQCIQPLQGNGGSLQSAIAINIPEGGATEEMNPTEAGNHADHAGQTTSRWVEAWRSKTSAFTKTHMAYYRRPGDDVIRGNGQVVKARGKNKLSNVTMFKRVTIGWKSPNVVHFKTTFNIPPGVFWANFEALCGYMPGSFNQGYVVNSGNMYRQIQPKSDSLTILHAEEDVREALVLVSGDVSMGVLVLKWPKVVNGPKPVAPWYTVRKAVGHKPWTPTGLPGIPTAPYATEVDMTKWGVAWRFGTQKLKQQLAPGNYSFEVALVFAKSFNLVQYQLARLWKEQQTK